MTEYNDSRDVKSIALFLLELDGASVKSRDIDTDIIDQSSVTDEL